MANPRIEEVDDASDPEEMDLDAFDFARPQQSTLQPATDPSGSQMTPQALQAILQQAQGQNPANLMQQHQQMPEKERLQREREAREQSKTFQCIYPVYFDATRSREQGRRVRKEDAVANPLAREIVDALQHIGQTKGVPFSIVFEPDKGHPKDWGNPGRVRVLIKRDGRAISAKVANKHHLYKLIAEYLKQHPTTEESAMKYRFGGMPPLKEKPKAPAVPRGFKIGSILPLHSPALSGGGVSDNFLKDMMSEMGGQMPPGMQLPPGMEGMMGAAAGGSGGAQPKKVKDKKKK
ncbi:signal recognition particle subunit [Elasticomyces elasticus]|nr:signal recognition particle subunit [Elasticomyces elasticus]KAK3651713.1 signal recognition particle subunit [Elasticomyces elasticus]KAK4912871.1 signal recognition particle subunit [Elasticomyces elasticus]KAK5769188.1 signal recognition particle subunit [Elasticomyces elasticus]